MVKIKYIVIFFAIAIGLGLLYFFLTRKKVSFDFNLGGNLAGLLGSMQGRYAAIADPNAKGIGLYIEVPLTTNIKNDSATKTVLENLVGSLSYEGEPVIQTKGGSDNLALVEVEGKSTRPITENVQLLISGASIKLISELIKGNKPEIKYNFGATVLGKPHAFTNNTIINNKPTS